jgi:hypothetical protein
MSTQPPDTIEVVVPGGPPGPPGPQGPAGPQGPPGSGTASSLTDLTDVSGAPGPGKSPVGDQTGVEFTLLPVTTQDDLDNVLAEVAAVNWHDIGAAGEPAFQSQFRNIGDPWSPARFRVLANSTVRLQGTVSCDDQTIVDSTWLPIFTLPGECAPGYSLEFGVVTNDNAVSKLLVWEDGEVLWGGYQIGSHATIERLPLNGISWSTGVPVPRP